jgi:hypothetical protein|nr:MAG TPA: hypothetical protein [Caudoviricetes sp.]
MEFLFGIRVVADVIVSAYWFGMGALMLSSALMDTSIKAPVLMICSLPICIGIFYLVKMIINVSIYKNKVKHNIFMGLISLSLIIAYILYIVLNPEQTNANRTLLIFIMFQMFIGAVEKGDDKNDI